MGYLAARDASDYRDAPAQRTTQSHLQALADGAKTKALVTDVLLGTAAAGATVTLILALSGGGEERTATASSSPGAHLALGGSSQRSTGQF